MFTSVFSLTFGETRPKEFVKPTEVLDFWRAVVRLKLLSLSASMS